MCMEKMHCLILQTISMGQGSVQAIQARTIQNLKKAQVTVLADRRIIKVGISEATALKILREDLGMNKVSEGQKCVGNKFAKSLSLRALAEDENLVIRSLGLGLEP